MRKSQIRKTIFKKGLNLKIKNKKCKYAVSFFKDQAYAKIKCDVDEKFLKELKKVIPMERLSDANEILGSLYFLADPASSYITGQNILIDGGRTII